MTAPMPKDNEVDEKAQTEELIRRPREVLGANGSGPETTLLARAQYHSATVAELLSRADAAERQVGELEALVRAIVHGRGHCFIPTNDPTRPTFNWDERADAALTGADPT